MTMADRSAPYRRIGVRHGLGGGALAAGLMLSGCAGVPGLDAPSLEQAAVTGTLGTKQQKLPANRGALAALERAHKEKPHDVNDALAYARSLRASGNLKGADAVLDAMAEKDRNRALLVERGMIALELGQIARSRKALLQATKLDPKDWRVLSALGIAEASAGSQTKARGYFKQALALAPGHPVVLNNMAMSYILQGKAAEAQVMLRDVARTDAATIGEAKPRVESNLALASALATPATPPKPAAKSTQAVGFIAPVSTAATAD